MNSAAEPRDVDIPPECVMLKEAYKTSGLTAADLAAATGLSVGSVHVAMNGIRYRTGEAKVTSPPDRTLVKLASVLHIHPDVLRRHGRDRAAGLLAEVNEADGGTRQRLPSDLEAQAAAHGRSALAKQVLDIFSTEELRDELERRDRADHDQLDQEGRDDAAADLRADLGVP